MQANWLLSLALGALAVGCGSVQDVKADPGGSGARAEADDDDDAGDDGDDDEVEVALDQVPAAIRDAALAAVPGLVLSGAEKETEEGSLHYCLEGTAGGQRVEVEVRASDAEVVEVERGEDD
jgi:hypothetical protein